LNRKALIVTSPTSEGDKTQAGLVYLASALEKYGLPAEIIGLSGQIDYFDPPEPFFSSWESPLWMNRRVFSTFNWLDEYIPSKFSDYGFVLYSALFSPDILIHGRHALKQKETHPETITALGGAAINCLNEQQIQLLSGLFDYVCVGFEVDGFISKIIKNRSEGRYPTKGIIIRSFRPPGIQPDFRIVPSSDFTTVYSGHGCRYGSCGFCNSKTCAGLIYHPRKSDDIARDFKQIAGINPLVKDVMLSSDSLDFKSIMQLTDRLSEDGINIPYNFMLRGESWVNDELGRRLADTGCTDVFIGVEALEDSLLSIINKGLKRQDLVRAIKILSRHVKVAIGLILFLPGVTKKRLDRQLSELEAILPFIHSVEPEILSVVQGSALAENPGNYGIQLWPESQSINDSWCFGLSPDIPWTFKDPYELDLWANHYIDLKGLLNDRVKPHYWESIEYVLSKYSN